jgi:hypothetical protein
MYGGIEDASNGTKIAPNGDVYSLKLHLSKFQHPVMRYLIGYFQQHLKVTSFHLAGDFKFF